MQGLGPVISRGTTISAVRQSAGKEQIEATRPLLTRQLPSLALHFGKTNVAAFPKFAPPPLNAAFHADRRNRLIASLPPNSALIISGATTVLRNGDVDHHFRQESNFYYLTGFEEPNAVAVLSNVPGAPRFTLVVPPRDPGMETWTGKRAGVEGAKRVYGADAAFENTELSKALKQFFTSGANLHVIPSETNHGFNRRLKALSTRTGIRLSDASRKIDEMRLRKTPYELALLKRACEISAIGHLQAMKRMKLTQEQCAKPARAMGRNEGEVQAELEYNYRRHGAVRQGYETIAGGGANGCVLHYNTNREYARPGDLMLVDSGAEYGHYTADITRTWPVSGKFTPAQKAIYDIVLAAQEAGIRMTKPGVTMAEIHAECVRVVTKGLMNLGILPGDGNDPQAVAAQVEAGAHQKYFMHGTSHMLGLDVHDVPLKSVDENGAPIRNAGLKNMPLEPGMFFTVEPGIYIDPEVAKREGLDPKWHGIGVRIEDDILVTANGHENFSALLPRTTEAIEALMAKGRGRIS